MTLFFCFLFLSWSLNASSSPPSLEFINATETIGLDRLAGNYAVGSVSDQNGDKWNDLVLVNRTNGQDNLTVLLWDIGSRAFRRSVSVSTHSKVVSLSSFDFDGDGWVDTLVTLNSTGYHGRVLWGDGRGPASADNVTDVPGAWQFLPLVLDINGDHIPDVLTVDNSGNLLSLISLGLSRSFNESYQIFNHHVSGDVLSLNYIDINSDCLSDVVLFTRPFNSSLSIDIWLRDSKTMEFIKRSTSVILPLGSSYHLYGQPVFADMNADGLVDVILITCLAVTCSDPQLHVIYQLYDPNVDIINCQPTSSPEWKLKLATVTRYNLSLSILPSDVKKIRPKIGDIDLDGYPDVLVVVYNSTSNYYIAHIYMNLPSATVVNDTVIRQLSVNEPFSFVGANFAMFIDIWEDGILDVLLVNDSESGSGLVAMQQRLSADHMFLKALVLSGHCYSECKSGHLPFGSILPAAVVAYETTDRNGYKIRNRGSTTQCTSYLNNPSLPYVILGLGATPNFIEKMTIGLPNNVQHSNWYRQWTLLVPNSQVILIPQPISEPSKWTLQLYLTPSGLIYTVSGVLLAVCAGLLVIVLLLHAREKYQDSKERKQSKLKFHFTAM